MNFLRGSMPTQNPEISLSQEELIYLLILLKTPTIPGLERQPMGVLEPEQVSLLMASAERSLMARGFIHPKADKTVGVDQIVLALVGTCAVPELSVLLTASFGGKKQVGQFYHASQAMAVEHAIVKPGVHRFTAFHAVPDFVPRIVEFFRLSPTSAPTRESISLPQKTYQKAAQIAPTVTAEAASLLSFIGLKSEVAEALARTLAKPVSNSAIVVIRHSTENAPTSAGFAILEGTTGLWLLQPKLDNRTLMVNLDPATPAEVLKRTKALLGDLN
jgi:hypothetical protein